MGREKKIGVSFFLNDRINPVKHGEEDCYPVYARITFNRKNHQCFFPLLYGDSYLSRPDFEKLILNREHKEVNKQLNEFEDKIRVIVKAEYSHFKDKFSFKGFSERLVNYDDFLLKRMNDNAKKKLVDSISTHLSNEQLKQVNNDFFDFWDTYGVIKRNFEKELKKAGSNELKISVKSLIYLSGFINSSEFTLDDPRVIDWFRSSLPITFKDYLFGITPIKTITEKVDLGFFQEGDVSYQKLLFMETDLDFLDISLIINYIDSVALE